MQFDEFKARIRYDKLDTNIVSLVKTVNSIPWVATLESCGGHPDPKPGQAGEGEWMAVLRFANDDNGWAALSFLTFVVQEGAGGVWLLPRFFTETHQGLAFVLAGDQTAPDKFANVLRKRIPAFLKAAPSTDRKKRRGRKRKQATSVVPDSMGDTNGGDIQGPSAQGDRSYPT